MNLEAWIDPNLLQIIGLGTSGDPYLVDGRHLRWFSGRVLGFPRSGYRLLRRPSPIDWDPELLQAQGVLRSQGTRRDLIQAADTAQFLADGRRLRSGLTVRRTGGLIYRQVYPGVDPFLQVDKTDVTLDFGPEDPPGATIGPHAVNPAAYVYLVVIRRKRTGAVAATAYYDAAGDYRFQDRAAVGARLRPWLPDYVVEDVLASEHGFALRSRSERGAAPEALRRRDRRIVQSFLRRRAAGGGGRGTAGRGTAGVAAPPLRGGRGMTALDRVQNPWVVEGLLLHGGLIDRVRVRGHDAVLAEVQWIPTRSWASDEERWSEVGRFFLPLTDAPEIYPEWTPEPGQQVAATRLAEGPPRAFAPWDEPTHPPPPADPQEMEKDLIRRYLDPGFDGVDEMMREFLSRELTEARPQADIAVTDLLEPDPATDPGQQPINIAFSPYDALVAQAVDPQMARLLGLATTDRDDLAGPFDYLVEADFPRLWLQVALNPAAYEPALEELRRRLDGRPLPWAGQPGDGPIGITTDLGGGMRAQRCISLATAIASQAVPLPHPPADLGVVIEPQAAVQPVQADVFAEWGLPAVNLFEYPRAVRVFYALRRRNATTDIALHESDDESDDLLLPRVPTGEMAEQGRFRVLDRRLERYGDYTYRLSAMDLFGRFSPFTDLDATIADIVAPPAPTALQCELGGSDEAAPVWPTFTLRFRWTAADARLAPDLDHFAVHLRQGRIPVTDGADAAAWSGLEHQPGVTSGAIVINAAALEPPSPAGPSPIPGPAGLAPLLTVEPVGDGSHDMTLAFGPISAPYDPAGFAQVSVTVFAVDDAANSSPPARRAVATRVDPGAPPPPVYPAEPQASSYPDARARAFYRVPLGPHLGLPAGTFAQVVRATQSMLLTEATEAQREQFGVGSPAQRAGLLRTLAVAHPELFSVDHERPHDHTVAEHWVELNGNDDAWTAVTTRTIGVTGAKSPWPTDVDAFVVIRVPRNPPPPLPQVEAVRAGDRSVAMEVAADPSGRTSAYRVFRTVAEPGVLPEVRRMLPVATLPLTEETVELIDDELLADVTYAYRVQAIGAAGVRSEATDAIEVRPWSSLPPDPGTVLTVIRAGPASPVRLVAFRVPRRDYATALFRLGDGFGWQVAAAPEALPLTDLGGSHDGTGWVFQVNDDVGPDAADDRHSYVVVQRDPRGLTATSEIVAEGP